MIIRCKTIQEAEKLVEITGSNQNFINDWLLYKEDTCYKIGSTGQIILDLDYNYAKRWKERIINLSDIVVEENMLIKDFYPHETENIENYGERLFYEHMKDVDMEEWTSLTTMELPNVPRDADKIKVEILSIQILSNLTQTETIDYDEVNGFDTDNQVIAWRYIV